MARHVTAPPGQERRLPMSYEEYLAWEDEGRHGEWVDGEVIVFMPPTDKHQAIVIFLTTLVSNFVDLFGLGVVRGAPYEMRIRFGGPSRQPDLLVVSRDHLERLTTRGLAGPADLVVEIVSPDSVRRDRVDKFNEYQEAGVREYWLVDSRPGHEQARFYHLMADGKYQEVLLDADGRYHSAVLPGFWLRPDWLWQDPLPNVMTTLATIAPEAVRIEVPGSGPGQRDAQGATDGMGAPPRPGGE